MPVTVRPIRQTSTELSAPPVWQTVYYHIRKLSDELCKEHNLSVIIPGAQHGRKYKEWQSEQNSSAWKTQIRKDSNFCIKSASTYEEFLLLMSAKGYEIKGGNF